VSCQVNIDVVSYPTSDGNSAIGLEKRGQVDTLILLPYSAEILQKNITPDSIVLLIETPRFYEYLLITRSIGGWQVDSVKSGMIFSEIDSFSEENNDDVRDPKDRFSLTHSGVVEYVKSDDKILRIPLRLIQKRDPSWLHEKEVQVSELPPPPPPPPPPMPLFQLEFELEIDSLNLNRNARVNFLRSQMEESCLSDSSVLIIQFILNETGMLSKFRVIKDSTPYQISSEKRVSCLEDVINELNLNFGELKSIPNARHSAKKMQHTLLLKRC
jgi:hypothetical protein